MNNHNHKNIIMGIGLLIIMPLFAYFMTFKLPEILGDKVISVNLINKEFIPVRFEHDLDPRNTNRGESRYYTRLYNDKNEFIKIIREDFSDYFKSDFDKKEEKSITLLGFEFITKNKQIKCFVNMKYENDFFHSENSYSSADFRFTNGLNNYNQDNKNDFINRDWTQLKNLFNCRVNVK